MSSINFTQKSKLSPLNLTSEAVHQILKQIPKPIPSLKKIYPTVKYQTEQIRSTTDINTHIAKKIKELDRIYSQQKKPKSRPNLCKTEIANNKAKNIVVESQEKNTQQLKCESNHAIQGTFMKKNDKGSSENIGRNPTQKYFEKVNKIKNLKLKQYMRNKFAIDIKTIETTRQENSSVEILEKEKKETPIFKPSFRHPKTQYKTKMILKFQKEKQKGTQLLNQTSPSRSYRQLEDSENKMLEIKLQKIMKKTQKFQKTQLAQKKFQFSRQFQENPADVRFERMLKHLSVILCSYGCFNPVSRPLPPFTRNCSKFTFYVGGGNNKNLIISVMKKRWWWAQTQTMSEANFVWTQLKQSKVLQSCKKYQVPRQPPLFQKGEEKIESNTAALRKNRQKFNQNKKNKLFHSKSKMKQFDENQIKKLSKQLRVIEVPKKLHNHYQGNSALGNKKALFYYISLYCQYKNINRYDYIPLTFHISNQRSCEIKNLQKAISSDPSSFWLIKPGQNSNRGNGISVTKSLTQIKQQIKNLTTNTLIIQKYIDNLFLYCCRKFDIRTYMLAITIAGSTKFYWHSEGYLRTSSYIYNLKDHDNLYVHLTNDAIQSTDDKYSKYEEGNKLSYQQFQRYLDQNYRNKNYSIKAAHQQMKNMAKLAVQATFPQINSSKLEYSFQVFGLDFILDSDFRPWLIQVNTNPCLELCSPCLQRLIPQMIQNAFRLAIDPVFQPCVEFPRSMSSSVPDNILLTNRFTLIFDQFFDVDEQWQHKLAASQSMQLNKDEQQQETFQGDGELINNI